MAASFNAIIIPVAAIGVADSVNMLLDTDELLSTPVLGDRLKRMSERFPSGRINQDDEFVAPVSLPKLPSQIYYLFGKVQPLLFLSTPFLFNPYLAF